MYCHCSGCTILWERGVHLYNFPVDNHTHITPSSSYWSPCSEYNAGGAAECVYNYIHFTAIAAYSFQFSLADLSITLATVRVCDSRVRDGTHTFTRTECVFVIFVQRD